MSALGIGVRVWVGWCPDDWATSVRAGAVRMTAGVISGAPMDLGCRRYWPIPQDGGPVWVWDALLRPLNDEPGTVTEPAEREAEA